MTDESANLRRLCQIADIRYKRWYLHREKCDLCADENGELCRDGLQLRAYALGFDVAVAILKGQK